MTKNRLKKSALTVVLILTLALTAALAAACNNKNKDKYESYTVTFDTDGGSAVEAGKSSKATGKVEKPANPSKDGYSFSGWYTEAGADGVEWDFDTVVTEEITLWARWTENQPEGFTPPAGYEIGKSYLIPAAAWHETNDQASMMGAMLYEKAYIDVKNDGIDVTIYFVPATIMQQPVSPSSVDNIRVAEDGTNYAAIESRYEQFTDVREATFRLSSLPEYTKVKMFNGVMNSDSIIRLKLTASSPVEAANPPSFALVEQTYLVPVAAWHASNDAASMMNPMMHEKAFVEIIDSKAEVTFYLKKTTLMGQPSSPVTITALKYKDGAVTEWTDAQSFEYDGLKDVLTVKIVLSDITANMTAIEMTNNGRASSIRLNLTLAGAEISANRPEFENVFASGKSYLVPVAAWYASNDAASMMNPLVYGYAYVEVGSDSIAVTVYFINGQVQPPMGGPVAIASSAITAFRFKDIGSESFSDAFLIYDDGTEVNRAEFTLSTTDVADLAFIVAQVSYPSNSNLRIKLTFSGAALAEGAPQFEALG